MTRPLNKLFHLLPAATVWLWAVALAEVWGRATDLSSLSLRISAAMALACFAAGLAAPAQVVRAGQTVVRRLYRPGLPWMPSLDPARPTGARQLRQFLGVSLMIAPVAGLAGAMLLLGGQWITRAVLAHFVLAPTAYRAWQVLAELPAMLAWGAGAAVVWQAQGLTRTSQGEDPLWRVDEDWLAGLAVAMGVAGLGWWLSWNPALMGLVAGLVQLACGLWLLRRPGADVAPGRSDTWEPAIPAGSLGRAMTRRRLGVWLASTVVGVAATLEFRGLADLLGVTMSGQLMLGTLWLGLVAVFHRRWVAFAPPSQPVAMAAGSILLAAVLGMQWALGSASLAGGAARSLAYVALLGLVPLAAGTGLLLVSLRRRFLSAGGMPQRFAQNMLLGLAGGVMVVLIVQAGPGGHILWSAGLLACLAVSIVAGIATCPRTAGQIRWALAGAALMLSMAAALAGAAQEASRRQGVTLRAGSWLTAWQCRDDCGYLPASPANPPPAWRLDQLAGEMIAHRRTNAATPPDARPAGPASAGGREKGDGISAQWADAWTKLLEAVAPPVPRGLWLAVCCRPLTGAGGADVAFRLAAADPAVFDLPAWKGQRGGAILQALRREDCQYNGVLYAPMPADHPAARALFNGATLSAVSDRMVPDGLLIVHAACRGSNLAPALAVARTVHEWLGESAVVARVGPDSVELLMFVRPQGSAEAAWAAGETFLRTAGGDAGVLILSSALSPIWDRVPAMPQPAGPACGAGAVVLLTELQECLRR